MIVSHILRLDQERTGFEVVEPDDHTVELRRHGVIQAVFTPVVTVHRLRLMADRIMWAELSAPKKGAHHG